MKVETLRRMRLVSVCRRRLLVCPRSSSGLETSSATLYRWLQRWSVTIFFVFFQLLV